MKTFQNKIKQKVRKLTITTLQKSVQKMLEVRVQVNAGQVLVIPIEKFEDAEALHYWEPTWKTEIIKRLLPLSSGDFIDVGANTGQTLFDFLFTNHQGRYIGFEPNIKCLGCLRKIVNHNRLQNCSIVPVGLSDSNQMMTLYLHQGLSMDSSASTISTLRPGRNFDTQFIPCYRFDTVRELIGIEKISLMKIDVEGAELAVLNGMKETLSKLRPFILCEVLHADSKVELDSHAQHLIRLMQLLEEARYTVFHLDKDWHTFKTLVKIDAFPVKYWTEENAEECDYLFVPTEDVDVVYHQFNLR